ncbi:hypothetical protein ACWGQ2_02255 [Arthrobacter sp. NPDC055585]
MNRVSPLDLVDVFVYTVVLEGVVWVKKRLPAHARSDQPGVRRGISAVTLLLVLPGSKLVVLEMTALVFRG